MGARDYEDATAMRRLRIEEEEDDAYQDAYEEIDDGLRAEWEGQFDSIPYKPNSNEIHKLAMARLRQDEDD